MIIAWLAIGLVGGLLLAALYVGYAWWLWRQIPPFNIRG